VNRSAARAGTDRAARRQKGIGMPDLDDQAVAAMQETAIPGVHSRRSVLRVAAGAGAAGIAASALGGVLATAGSAPRAVQASPDSSDQADPVVLHVRDAAAGEIDVFRGTTHTRLHDRDLAARILRASR
jgi:hypothetical protein